MARFRSDAPTRQYFNALGVELDPGDEFETDDAELRALAKGSPLLTRLDEPSDADLAEEDDDETALAADRLDAAVAANPGLIETTFVAPVVVDDEVEYLPPVEREDERLAVTRAAETDEPADVPGAWANVRDVKVESPLAGVDAPIAKPAKSEE